MKKYLSFLVIFLVLGCRSLELAKDSSLGVKQDTFPFLNYWYELVGIETNTDFLIIEPGHGGSGLIKFNNGGTIETTSGFNSGKGEFTYKASSSGFDSLTIKNLNLTQKNSSNEQEKYFDTLFFSHLNAVKSVKIESKIIYLYDSNKKEVLRFYRKG